MFRLHVITVFLGLSLMPWGYFAAAQSGDVIQVKPTKVPPSLPVLYRSFLAYQLHLDQKADALKQQGRNGEDFRTHYQLRLGFSDQEFAVIRASATHLDQVLKAKDAEIHDTIKAAREALSKGPYLKGTAIPGPPPKLKTLFTERQTLITSEIETLHKKLTPTDTTKLENFLQKDFAPSVTVGTLPAHTARPSLLNQGANR